MKTMLEEVHQVGSWGFYQLHTAPPTLLLLVEACCPKDVQALVYSQFFLLFSQVIPSLFHFLGMTR